MAEEKKIDNEIDSNLIEIIKQLKNQPKLTEQEKNKLIEEIRRDFDFEGLIKKIQTEHPLNSNKYVVFTTGKEQLYYEDGEFFVISATDSKKLKRKLKRKEALDMYNEYFITNILNPLIKQKSERTKDTTKEIHAEKGKEDKDIVQDIKTEDSKETPEVEEVIKKQDQIEDINTKEHLNEEKEEKDRITTNSDIEARLNELKQREDKLKSKKVKKEEINEEVKNVKKKQEKEIEL